jgi:hypothetical protein
MVSGRYLEKSQQYSFTGDDRVCAMDDSNLYEIAKYICFP